MQFAREIRRILFALFAALALIGFSAAYWALTGQASLLLREDNPRLIEAQARIQRGSIYDRNGQLLAETRAGDSGLERRYLSPATYSAVGYYSLRYGSSGAEAAFDTLLAGRQDIDSLERYFALNVLRQPPIGADIMLTLDADIQALLVAALDDAAGAAVVMQADSGAIRALISQPSFDPNTLDADWAQLIEAAGKPFFNRALQGNYQLGSAMYLLWLAQAIEADFPLARLFDGASAPVALDSDTTLTCVITPPADSLSLIEATIYGCPAAFQSYRQIETTTNYAEMIAPYHFDAPITLAGFPLPEQLAQALPASDEALDPAMRALRNTLGQGDVTATPLHLTAAMAAIANRGSAPAPRMLAAQRPPGGSDWLVASARSSAIAMLPAATAEALQGILRESWATLQAQPPADFDVGATLAMSHSGEDKQIWLSGFAAATAGETLAFLILLEDSVDAPRLLAIGQQLIQGLPAAVQ